MSRKYTVAAVVMTSLMCGSVFAATTFNVRALSGDPGLQPFAVDVSEAGDGQALFTIRTIDTEGPWAIAGAYFYDGVLLGIDQPTTGVFEAGASGHLPGVDLSAYNLVSAYVSAGADPQDTLGVLFNLRPDKTYGDVVAGINDGTILIGIKGSAAVAEAYFVAVPAVPVPGALLLSSIGAGCVALFRRRKVA